MSRLFTLRDEVQTRTNEIASAHGHWPCRKGCDDCCRHLASEPRVSRDEWLLIADALNALPVEISRAARVRIRESAGMPRPVTCPLLDSNSGSCLVYEARPLACRAYGFYAEREMVLGCGRIELLSRDEPGLIRGNVVWGNHTALEERMRELGPSRELSAWAEESASGIQP